MHPSNSNPVLVTGAAGRTGAIGPSVVRTLISRGFKVRAMVQQEDDRAHALRQHGAEVFVGDLLDMSAVSRAMQDVRRLYFSMSMSPAYLQATTTVAAVARERGLDAFVNLSQMHVSRMSVDTGADSPQHRQHWLAERVLEWSGIPTVTLRPTSYMDVLFRTFAAPAVRRSNVLMLPFGSGKTAPVAAADVADCVAEILTDPAPHVGKSYELTGPRSLDLHAIARVFSSVLGRSISYIDVPQLAWEAQIRSLRASPHLLAHLRAVAKLHREGEYDRHSNDVERLTGRPPTSFEDFVQANIAAYAVKHGDAQSRAWA